MTKITRFDRANCALVQQAVTAALAALGAKYGLQLTLSGGRFSAAEYTMQLKINPVSEDGMKAVDEAFAAEAADFKALAKRYDLRPDDLGKEVLVGRDRYIIVGLKTSSIKYPILGRAVKNDKVYGLPLSAVQFALSTEQFAPINTHLGVRTPQWTPGDAQERADELAAETLLS